MKKEKIYLEDKKSFYSKRYIKHWTENVKRVGFEGWKPKDTPKID